MFDGEEDDHTASNSKPVIKSRQNLKRASKNDGETNNHVDGEMNSTPTPVFNPEDLIGKTILMDKQEDSCQTRATIVKLIEDHESSIHDNCVRIKFLLSLNNDQGDDIVTYNKLLTFLSAKMRNLISHGNFAALYHIKVY
jgi:hypothetical protein